MTITIRNSHFLKDFAQKSQTPGQEKTPARAEDKEFAGDNTCEGGTPLRAKRDTTPMRKDGKENQLRLCSFFSLCDIIRN